MGTGNVPREFANVDFDDFTYDEDEIGTYAPVPAPTTAPVPASTTAPVPAPVAPPTSSDDDGGACFSGNMKVVVQGKGEVAMEALQVGDYVKIGNGEDYERIYAFGHRAPNRDTEFVQLYTNAGSPL